MQALAGKRRVDGDSGIGECVEALLADCLIGGRRRVLVRRVNANAGIAPHHAEQALIVQGVQQVSRGVRGASPIILDCTVREVVVDFAGVYGAAFTDEIQEKLSPFAASCRPVLDAFSGHATLGARMHELLQRSRHEAVVDKKVFRDAELGVAAFEIACTVIFHSVAQDKILRAGGCADRVGLDET